MKNQFRSLDEDEIDFLDSVLESSRSKEAEVKKETREQLDAFRRQREEAEKAARDDETVDAPPATEVWSVGPRKRKKGRETEGVGGLKLRITSTADNAGKAGASPQPMIAQPTQTATNPATEPRKTDSVKGAVQTVSQKSVAKPQSTPVLGLAAYSSDEDD